MTLDELDELEDEEEERILEQYKRARMAEIKAMQGWNQVKLGVLIISIHHIILVFLKKEIISKTFSVSSNHFLSLKLTCTTVGSMFLSAVFKNLIFLYGF